MRGVLQCTMAMLWVIFFATTFAVCGENIRGNVLSQKFPTEDDLEYVTISNDGKYAIVGFEDKIMALSIHDGKTLWTRKYKDNYDGMHDCVTWVSPYEVTVPTETALEWVDLPTGKVIASVPFIAPGLEELVNKGAKYADLTWSVRPRRLGYILLVPFEKGYQLFDLRSRKEFFRSKEELSEIHLEWWGTSVLMYGDMETAIVMDIDQARVLAQHKVEGAEFDTKNYQNIVRYRDQVALITEEEVYCYDGATNKRTGILGFDPDDVDSYHAVLVNDHLYFLTKSEEFMRLYDIASAKMVWSVSKGMKEAGELVDVWPMPDGTLLVELDHSDDTYWLSKLELNTGNPVWEKRIVKSNSDFEPGLTYSKPLMTLFGQKPLPQLYAPIRTDSLERQTYFTQLSIDSARQVPDWRFVNLMSNEFIHRKSVCVGYVRLISVIGQEIILQSVGEVQQAWDGKISENEYDAEGVLRLDLQTGAVKGFTKIPFFKHLNYTDINVRMSSIPWEVENGWMLLGTHTVANLRLDATLDTTGFLVDDEKSISAHDFGKDYVSFYYKDDDDDHYDWKVTATPNGLRRELIGNGHEQDAFHVFDDTTFVPATLRWIDGRLEGYPVMDQIPKQWPKPMWTVSREQLEKIGQDDAMDDDLARDAAGIFSYKDFIFVLGKEGLGVIDPKTGCMKTIEWEGYDQGAAFKYPIKRFGYNMDHAAMFDLGDDVGMVSLGPGCDVKLIGYLNESRSDLKVVYTEQARTMLVINTVQNTLDVFQIK